MKLPTKTVQYTIRGILPEVEVRLRQIAAKMAVEVALDTNRMTDLLRGDSSLADFLATCDEVWMPLVVLAEMKAGFCGGNQQHRNGRLLQTLLAKPTIGILLPDRETAEPYARPFVQLKRAGTPIPDNNFWIAALTL